MTDRITKSTLTNRKFLLECSRNSKVVAYDYQKWWMNLNFFVVSGLESSYNVFLRQMMVFLAYEGAWQKTIQFVWGQLTRFYNICKQKQNDEKSKNWRVFTKKSVFGNQWTRFFIRNWFDVCVKFMMDAWKGKIAALVNHMMLNASRTELKTNFLFKVEPTNFGFPPLWFKRHPLPCHWIL